jgi:hypothetical protein
MLSTEVGSQQEIIWMVTGETFGDFLVNKSLICTVFIIITLIIEDDIDVFKKDERVVLDLHLQKDQNVVSG